MPLSCMFCEIVGARHNNPTFIADFQHSAAFLNFDQTSYPGQSLLIVKEHHEHLHNMADLAQAIMPEQLALARALIKVYYATRINYECLGNEVAHVHWHLVPRQSDDLNAGGPPVHRQLPITERLSDIQYQKMATPIRTALRL